MSPKLTVGITPFDPVTFYATYAEGYRAPSITETLIDGFHPPPVSTGRFIPNPDLKPEVAHSLEGGVNIHKDGLFRADDQFRAKLGVFRNQVDDYIEQQFEMFPIPGGYQYQNVANATLEGVELEAGYDAGFAFASFSGQVMRGVDEFDRRGARERPAQPHRRHLRLPRLRPGARGRGPRSPRWRPRTAPRQLGLVGDAYQVVDLFAAWQLSEDASANVTLSNIFDRRYTQYPNGSPSPGFNAKVSFVTKIGG